QSRSRYRARSAATAACRNPPERRGCDDRYPFAGGGGQRRPGAGVDPAWSAGSQGYPRMTPAVANPRLRRLRRWLLLGEWQAQPLRMLMALAAIALGVALGYAVHLVNAAAFNEFNAAVKSLSGNADMQVRGTGPWLDESMYPALAARPEVLLANP